MAREKKIVDNVLHVPILEIKKNKNK